MMREQYAVVVPVKPPTLGKSRLVGLPAERRRDLATAFALDTVAACLAADSVARVLVVTDDVPFARRLTEAGCAAIPDGVAGDLNGSLRLAAAMIARRAGPGLCPWPCADLPSLRPEDLDEALWRTSLRTVPPSSPTPPVSAPRAPRRMASSTRASGRTHGQRMSMRAPGRFRRWRPGRDVDDVADCAKPRRWASGCTLPRLAEGREVR